MTDEIKWAADPEEKDYVGAASFLSLVFRPAMADQLARGLRDNASRAEYAAKDILRQSLLICLPHSDSQVIHVLHKVADGKEISPVLLIRGDYFRGRPLLVADGYHRVCAAYHLGDDTMVRCHIGDVN